jgi:hypothetical protein
MEPMTRAVSAPSFNFLGAEVVVLGIVSIDVALIALLPVLRCVEEI